MRFRTVGVIAERLGVPIHRVRYVIRSRRITSAGMAGMAHVYDDAAVSQIESELRRIKADREAPKW